MPAPEISFRTVELDESTDEEIMPMVTSSRSSVQSPGPLSVSLTYALTKSKPLTAGSVGLSDPVLSELRRKKLDIINRLHSIGTQRDIDLPSLVVIGSQSAGKSSLIESISGINLPRSSGTCTRCPTECRLVRTSGSEPWQCTVSLRFLTDEHGRSLDRAQNIQFGPPIKNPKDVEERLRRAQLAVLNPSITPQVFLESSYQQVSMNSLNFSSNTVCLEIKGPEVTDLSFCDLPGLIASVADGGRDEEVEEVRELVSAHIQNPSSIILLTVACEVDFETQGAYRLAKKFDPEGVRTIGVLTKPDRIPEREHSRWFKLIRNESSPLQNGWFCVKQLSSAELEKKYSFEEARQHCEGFFKKDPWNSLDSISKRRLGTGAVTAKLNDFLMNVISKKIPEITQELQTRIQKTRDEMQVLPAPPSSDPVLEMMHLVNEFCDTLYNYSQGIGLKDQIKNDRSTLPSNNHFELIHKEQKKFQATICATGPKFKPWNRGVQPPPLAPRAPVHPTTAYSATSPDAAEEGDDETTYLNDIADTITRAITRELPDFSPFHVVQNLITQSTEKWEKPVFNLVNDIFHIVLEHQMRLLKSHFEKYTEGGLLNTVKNLVYAYTQRRKENAETQLRWILKLESCAFTLNDSIFLKHKEDCLKGYQVARRSYNIQSEDASPLTVMATAEAYFEVAHRRFIDNVPLAIDHELVRLDKRSLQEVLCKGLKLTDPHAKRICARLMAEPAHITDLREELNGRLERLCAAQIQLMDV